MARPSSACRKARREAAGIFPITAGDEFYVFLPFIWKHMFVYIYIYTHITMYYIISTILFYILLICKFVIYRMNCGYFESFHNVVTYYIPSGNLT